MRARGERVERSFAHCLDRGGMRRVHLRGLANVEKRYIIHVAGLNLGILLRALFGFGTPRGWADTPAALLIARIGNLSLLILVICPSGSADKADRSVIFYIRWNN